MSKATEGEIRSCREYSGTHRQTHTQTEKLKTGNHSPGGSSVQHFILNCVNNIQSSFYSHIEVQL